MDDDFDRFLEASNDDEESFLQPTWNAASASAGRSPVRGGSPSYRGKYAGAGGGYRSSDPLASIDLSSLPIPERTAPKSKVVKSTGAASRGRAEPSASPTVRSGMRQSSDRVTTPSAKSEPAKTKPSPTAHSDSESSVSHGHSDGDATGTGAMASIFANFKAEMEQQLRESAEEQKRQEDERERKKKEEEEKRRKEAEEEEERRKREVEEEEKRRKEVEEEDKRRKEAEEEERRKKKMEDEERKKKEAEEEDRRNKEAEEGARRRREMEEEARRKKELEQEETSKKEAEKAELRRKEEEAKKEREVAEAEQARLKVEDEQRKEAENRRHAEELEAKRLREEEQRKREAAEAEAARIKELKQRELEEAERREQEQRRRAEEQEAAEAKRKLEELRRMESEALDRKMDERIARHQIEIGQRAAADVRDSKRAEETARGHAKDEASKEAIGDWKEVRHHQAQNAISDFNIKKREIGEMKSLRTKTREDQLYDEEAAHRLVFLFFSLRAWSESCEGGRVRKAGVRGASHAQVCRKFAECATVAHDWARMTQAFACWSRLCASTATAVLDRKAQDQLAAAAQQVADTTCKQSVLLQQVAHLEQEVARISQERDALSGDLEALLHKGPGAGRPNSQDKTSDLHDGRGDRTQKLEADLHLAEKMLRACEKENENLATQNRQLRQGARLRREEVDGRQLQLVAELNAAKASADANPASMARLVDLERELVAVKERADEHAKELERCREAKRQLEREMITGPLPKAAHSEELEHAEARLAQSRSEVSELQAKLLFYAQGQQEMEEDRRQVLRLGEELRAALGENAELRKRPAKEASKKIAELRKQNDELHECLRKRHPDSLLALIKACEPPPEEKRKLSELKGRILELEAQLAEQDALYDRRIRALRAQYDHMRHEYERRAAINRVPVPETEEPKRAAPDREAILQARIKDLERQVEHTKSYYLSKLRKREPLVPSGKSNKAAVPTPSGGHGAHHNQGDARHVQQLQLQLQAQEDRIAELTSAAQKEPCSMVFLRLLLASPEALALLAFCVIQRWLHMGSGNSEEVRKQILQDAEAQAGLDHRLPWNQLLAVLARAGVPPGLLDSIFSRFCCAAAVVLQLCHAAGSETRRHQMVISSSGMSHVDAVQQGVMRREVDAEARDVDAALDDVHLSADAAKFDVRFGTKEDSKARKTQNDCTGLKEASECTSSEVQQSAAACESHKASKGPQFYRCTWKKSEPNHGDEPAVPAECYLDEKAGPCSTWGDTSSTSE
ncbi:HYDIN [Symbiodinium sp. CCMP2592]|nr:HYDIN [Symbiodinium sp. CCMP2592]